MLAALAGAAPRVLVEQVPGAPAREARRRTTAAALIQTTLIPRRMIPALTLPMAATLNSCRRVHRLPRPELQLSARPVSSNPLKLPRPE